ncbi:aminotransferase class I/II-fold pyridoxal phosphate-dependent enzyme [Anaerocolumna sp. AGMB13025]|uniref:aminotransferase class I/II-fold pyridoxal phosphate-dependent enzyme n=1 Tax=Anaerocolumna sp. AGMB13025 TaxID=3039116 RepID=UPI00241D2662|nr:aminotransferase class I/II-fold pyridoxal phosphate-dependent enzyme [Anaerocolumna sp. AGMB13025]WFR59235.1 aminotransferase class I/II-fold pyridoxal phosphate-dependent enzyme [Anaerocolumna sp. AGMB13025]
MNLRTFQLEDYYDKHEFSTPYLLSQSDCESMTIRELLSFEPGAEEAFLETWLGYTEVKGDVRLREKAAALYKTCQSEEILIHAGAEEAVFNFMQIFLQTGDHMIYLSPAYQSLYEVAASRGCEVSPWKLCQSEEGWSCNFDDLVGLIKQNTKLLVINTPHNPTGYSFTEEELKRIAVLAREHNIFVFCDQVYKDLEWDGEEHSWFCDLYENSLSLGVMSKAYGLPGLRIGWIATHNKEVYESMVKYKYYTTICSSAPSEFLSVLALKHRDRILKRNISLIKDNIEYAENFFEKYSDLFINNKPQAGPIAFHKLKITGGITGFCEKLIEKKGVLLLPGDVYEVDGDYFRMGYGRKNFKKALIKLDEYLAENI